MSGETWAEGCTQQRCGAIFTIRKLRSEMGLNLFENSDRIRRHTMAEPSADLIAWLASVNEALVVYAKVFASVGYSNFALVGDMDHEERDDILEALDKAGIMKVRNLGRSRRGGALLCARVLALSQPRTTFPSPWRCIEP